MADSETLLDFARANDSAASTTKKLVKQSTLAEYLRPMVDADLRRAVRFCVGQAFPSTCERVLNVGGAILNSVILSLRLIDPREYHNLILQAGEIGEALAAVWAKFPPDGSSAPPLSLADLEQGFEDLANTGNQQRKREILKELFSRCIDPREAAYLAKIIFRDMRTGVQEGVLQAAVAQAFDKPLKAIQRAQLLLGDLDEVAILAKHDRLESATFRLFHPIQFMLAAPQETAEEAAETLAGRTFIAEDKLDGIRAQVHKQADRLVIYTRTMDRTDESFPDVVEALQKIEGDFLLDGEIVPFRDGQVLPFAHLQRRLGRKTFSSRILHDNPAVFVPFDILYLNGRNLMDEPYDHRRRVLEDLLRSSGQSYLLAVAPVSTADQIRDAFDQARSRRNEGIVLKDPASPYSPGRRGKMWLKLKTHLPTFDCVVTAAEYGHGKRRQSLSDYTFAVWDRSPSEPGATLVNIGKAYSGVTDEEIARLTELFLQISREQRGHCHIVSPQVVLEIACDQIQKSKRHASGYALRFPRIKRIRWDKRPEDADVLATIEAAYGSPENFAHSSTPLPDRPADEGQMLLFDA